MDVSSQPTYHKGFSLEPLPKFGSPVLVERTIAFAVIGLGDHGHSPLDHCLNGWLASFLSFSCSLLPLVLYILVLLLMVALFKYGLALGRRRHALRSSGESSKLCGNF